MSATTPFHGFSPSGWQKLANPSVQTVLLVGCGGGFDFVHSLLLYQDLVALGKTVVIGSYSFGDPRLFTGKAVRQVFGDNLENATTSTTSSHKSWTGSKVSPVAFLVDSSCEGDKNYCPEIGFCKYLDQQYPSCKPHSIYAYYARAFTVASLTQLYEQLILEHNVDAIVAIDGGSDSLMRGDEEGLGDPIEDAVTVAAVAAVCDNSIIISNCNISDGNCSSNSSSNGKSDNNIIYDASSIRCNDSLASLASLASTATDQVASIRKRPLGILCAIGVGCDRFNGVTDADSFRAVSEVTRLGGYLGALALEPSSPQLQFYRDGLSKIYELQSFRSVLSGAIAASALGFHGTPNLSALDDLKVDFDHRIRQAPQSLFLLPFMSFLWFFDVKVIADRSLICSAIKDCNSPEQADALVAQKRRPGFGSWIQERTKLTSTDTDTSTIQCREIVGAFAEVFNKESLNSDDNSGIKCVIA